MAIQINELNVKLHLGDKSTSAGAADTAADCCETINKEDVVEDAVKEVIRILKEQKER